VTNTTYSRQQSVKGSEVLLGRCRLRPREPERRLVGDNRGVRSALLATILRQDLQHGSGYLGALLLASFPDVGGVGDCLGLSFGQRGAATLHGPLVSRPLSFPKGKTGVGHQTVVPRNVTFECRGVIYRDEVCHYRSMARCTAGYGRRLLLFQPL